MIFVPTIYAQTATTPATSPPAATATLTDPLNIWGAGISWNQGASASAAQQFAGTAMYARQQTSAGTYAFTVFDAVPTTLQPVTVTTDVAAGVAQRVFTVAGWQVYLTAAAGPSWSGAATGWAWTGGGMATHAVGKSSWWIGPNIRTVKSSVNNNSGYQLIAGLLAGGS
jgi:hypothetical protein